MSVHTRDTVAMAILRAANPEAWKAALLAADAVLAEIFPAPANGEGANAEDVVAPELPGFDLNLNPNVEDDSWRRRAGLE